MKCCNCNRTYYDEGCEWCGIFGEEIPEKYQTKSGEGCKLNRIQIEKFAEQNRKDWERGMKSENKKV